jgi:transcriptional regulator with XRE-family HTH domain
MTQQDLADAARVDLKTVYNLESGARWPIARTRAAIAAALGWGPDALGVLAAGGDPVPLAGAGAPRAVPVRPAQHEDDFGGRSEEDREALRPYVQEILRAAYERLGLLDRFGPGPLPDPYEIGAEGGVAAVPGQKLFPGSPRDAQTWDDPDLTVRQKLNLIGWGHLLGHRADERENRRTGLLAGNFPAAGTAPWLFPAGRRAIGASS